MQRNVWPLVLLLFTSTMYSQRCILNGFAFLFAKLMADFHDDAVLGVYGRTEPENNTDSMRSRYLANRPLQTTDKFYSSNFPPQGKLGHNRNDARREIPRRT